MFYLVFDGGSLLDGDLGHNSLLLSHNGLLGIGQGQESEKQNLRKLKKTCLKMGNSIKPAAWSGFRSKCRFKSHTWGLLSINT